MESLTQLNYFLDPVLIAPYRWLENPWAAWWLGTFILAGWCVLLGELTIRLAMLFNRRQLEQYAGESTEYQDKSIAALKSGRKETYRSINRLANEAFGRAFFLQAAMGIGSLWPCFFSAAWLQERFGHLRFNLPGIDLEANFVPGFIVCYVLARIMWWQIKKRWVDRNNSENPNRAV